MIKKILVPIDGSKRALKALEYAVDLAKQTGSLLILLSVIDKTSFYGLQTIPSESSPTHLLETLEDYLRQTSEAYVAEAEGLCRSKGVESQNIVKDGHPFEEIIKAAEDMKIDLIVMGSHGKSALMGALLGSVTMRVIHMETKVPVLIVR
jgi:nucleotide-binding universal stress UspA family protein